MIKKEKKNTYLIKNFFNKKSSRRDFLKWIGFSTASVTLTACKGPVIKSIPYIVKPDNISLGIPVYYATTMVDSFDMACVLVKTREGRPIKIEPNFDSSYFNTVSARIQSSLLSLYDEEKFKFPYLNGKISNWKSIDNYIIKNLKYLNKTKKHIIFISPSFPSFSTKEIIKDFKKKYPNTKWIIYDPISYSKILDASKNIFGRRAIPFFDLKNIDLIVSFDADFLGDWIPENIEKYYANNRNLDNNTMIQHIHIESNMSISGANSDKRISKKPTDIKKMLFDIYQCIFFGKEPNDNESKIIYSLIKKKWNKCVIFADGDKDMYEMSFLINKKINSNAIKNKKFILSKESDDKKFYNFIDDLKKDNIGALFINDLDIIYNLPSSISNIIKKSIKNIPLTVSFSTKKNETNKIMKVIAPIPHWLESWGDLNPISNYYTLIQPTIQKIFNTRQLQDSIIRWSNINEINYYEYLKKKWEKNIIPYSNCSSFNEALFKGFVKTNKNHNNKKLYSKTKILKTYKITNDIKNKFELRLYTKTSMGDGFQYNNPWLHELPDPITRTTWGNYMTISHHDSKKFNIKNWNTTDGSLNGNCVNIIKNNIIVIKNIPAFIQYGQAIGSIGIAFGYGQKIGKLSNLCDGKNSYKIYDEFNIIQKNIKIEKTNIIHKFACVQLQNSPLERDIIRETNLDTFLKYPKKVWNKKENINDNIWNMEKNKIKNKNNDGHHFNLSIDLNTCIGCGSCIIACNSENNIPVVGKDEIRNFRDMHWIRIDRYYHNDKKKLNRQSQDNPKVSFQPIMCQHCEYAPCETVCPVGATTHGSQGQNMMTYNRCIGTRYCANNCPYKVRRFNWFNYLDNKDFDFHMNNTLGKMVLNPDVVTRTRGVMEKCSLCIQRTQYSITKAKKEKRKVKDNEFETACSIVCPTKAITFGDIKDKNSIIRKKINNIRSYKLLEFIGISPNVNYLVKIRNDK
ncbi:4Fe-4S dicluster domain-containing protein [Blattabacterium cuenoti]|uniref:4Fe-4S dicluster domain-containing protein n=1 Tax=Blattabacterium cuenoti TaxID=1653831 RepID=UPI00163C2BD0|nr:4Fe-4S dicluster domain-containing protein [Blattabacterium cuenoti]